MNYILVRPKTTKLADGFVMVTMMEMMAVIVMAIIAVMAVMVMMAVMAEVAVMTVMVMAVNVHALHHHQKMYIPVPFGYPAIPCSAWALVRSSVK